MMVSSFFGGIVENANYQVEFDLSIAWSDVIIIGVIAWVTCLDNFLLTLTVL